MAVEFNKTITLGNIISLLTLMGGGIIIFADFKVELAVLKNDVSTIQSQAAKTSSNLDDIGKSVQQLIVSAARQEGKLQDIKARQN